MKGEKLIHHIMTTVMHSACQRAPVHAQSTPLRCSTKIQHIVLLISLYFDLYFDVLVGPLDVFADLLKCKLDVLLLDDHLDDVEITIIVLSHP